MPPFTSLFLDRPADRKATVATVNTVLGAVEASQLGVTLLSEALMYVLPGAEYAFDIRIDRAEVFDRLAARLAEFKAAGGGTIVDATGMFQGRDLRLYEALSRATGVHIVATSGQGPENMLGGYFLTPQTNPPTPWPAQKFAEMFGREVNEGMVVPRLERRAPAGMICTAVSLEGMTATDGSLVRGAARAGGDVQRNLRGGVHLRRGTSRGVSVHDPGADARHVVARLGIGRDRHAEAPDRALARVVGGEHQVEPAAELVPQPAQVPGARVDVGRGVHQIG